MFYMKPDKNRLLIDAELFNNQQSTENNLLCIGTLHQWCSFCVSISETSTFTFKALLPVIDKQMKHYCVTILQYQHLTSRTQAQVKYQLQYQQYYYYVTKYDVQRLFWMVLLSDKIKDVLVELIDSYEQEQ